MTRLSKALAECGIASRRKSEKLITTNRVKVNGKITSALDTTINWETDSLSLDGKPLVREKKVYFLLHKPTGLICADPVPGRPKSVLDLFSSLKCRLFTVGRLDKDTSGLILITNDGEFAQRVIHPSFNITKEYLVKVRQEISAEHLQTIMKGTRIENSHVSPVKVKKVRRGTLKITVKEGKKHEVRLLIAAAGLELLELSRIRLGPLTLDRLEWGQHRSLTHKELLSFD